VFSGQLIPRWHRLHYALQRMLIHAGQLEDGLNTCGGNVPGTNPDHAPALMMNLQHYARGLFQRFPKDVLNDHNNKIHWCVVIIQQNDLIHGRGRKLSRISLRHRIMLGQNLSPHDNN